MTDNQLFTLVRSMLLAQMPARGLAGWEVARSFQPEQQGANTGPTVYLAKIGGDRRVGSPQKLSKWDEVAHVVNTAESQQYESTFQASIDMDESTNPATLTPSDAANIVTDIMQSDEGLAALRAGSVGILRIGDVRNPYNVDDRNRFDANPSFDFVLTYRRGFQQTTPHAVTVESSFNRV